MRKLIRQLMSVGCLLLVVSFAIVLGCGPGVGGSDPCEGLYGHCGDGVVASDCSDGGVYVYSGYKKELCDDGNSDDSDQCGNDCTWTGCGDGILAPGEQCDDGNLNNEDACSNHCAVSNCVIDTDCTGGKLCLATHCQAGCRTDAECSSSGKICSKNACVPPCTADNECRFDQICEAGGCVRGCRDDNSCEQVMSTSKAICDKSYGGTTTLTATPCTCASQCSGNEICSGGVCGTAGSYTETGTCRQGCRNDTQCTGGKVCSGSGDCVAPCSTSADCCASDNGNSGDTCVSGHCVDSCTVNSDCPNGNVCNASICIPGCTADADCQSDKVCNGGICAALPCGVGSKCVFITSAAFSADFGGATGADARCQGAANHGSNALRGRRFKAWISDASSSPSTRFVQSSVPYKLLDGSTVANDWADLTDGNLSSAIYRDELGAFRLREGWTNTTTSGTAENPAGDPTLDSCANWTTTAAGSGRIGFGSEQTISNWTQGATFGCGMQNALFCFQQ